MTNTERCHQISSRRSKQMFAIGALVREPHGDMGVVDKVFADLEAAFDAGETGEMTPERWYAMQSKPPKTPKDGIWYGVILYDKLDGSGGTVLAGQDDLTLVGW